MLKILTKKGDEIFVVDSQGNELVRIVATDFSFNKVKLEFEFVKQVNVWRGKVHQQMQIEKAGNV